MNTIICLRPNKQLMSVIENKFEHLLCLKPSRFSVNLQQKQTMAGETAVSTASKPVMRGLLNAAIKRNLIVAIVLSGVSGILFKQLVGTNRKNKYAEFYKNYDAEKEFEVMRKKGLFQSC